MFLAARVLSSSSGERKVKRGAFQDAARTFDVAKRTINRIWNTHKHSITMPEKHNLNVKRRKGGGRKFKVGFVDVRRRVKAIPFSLRKSLRALSSQIDIPRTSLHRYLKLGVLSKSRSAVKPSLTDTNKVARVEYCKRFVDADGCFEPMLDYLDVNEKWWYLTEKSCSYIFVPGEELPPNCFVKHKSHIIKVVCLCVSAWPR